MSAWDGKVELSGGVTSVSKFKDGYCVAHVVLGQMNGEPLQDLHVPLKRIKDLRQGDKVTVTIELVEGSREKK